VETEFSENPDKEKFNEYFSDIGLGKLAKGAQLPGGMEQGISTFLSDESICVYGTLKKSVIIGLAIFNPETASYEVERQDFPQALGTGGFASCGSIMVGSGKYEYKVYIEDKLVAVLPFEVK